MVHASRSPRARSRGPVIVPASFIERIVETLHPEEIWLFGSRARGDHRPDSDWDLLAVLPDTARDDEVDLVETWRRLRDLRVQRVEIFPIRRSDFEAERHALGTLCQIAESEGWRVHAA
jgi:predicted nucleotidyltransferase